MSRTAKEEVRMAELALDKAKNDFDRYCHCMNVDTAASVVAIATIARVHAELAKVKLDMERGTP